jgi:dipeptidyl aminopeptidase/acylaminoacyl peptidase
MVCAFYIWTGPVPNALSEQGDGKRPVTIDDAIKIRRLADEEYFMGASSTGRVAHFSPDGKRFVIELEKGNLKNNTNDFSLFVFETETARHSPKAHLELTMSSSSNREGIKNIKWLSDNETVVFVGENPGELSQVYSLNLRTHHLKRLTRHPTAITDYDIVSDGSRIVFAADTPARPITGTVTTRREGLVVTHQRLLDLLEGDCAQPFADLRQLFLQDGTQPPVRIPLEDALTSNSPIVLSPDGSYATLRVWVRDVPASWTGYKDKDVHRSVDEGRIKGRPSGLMRYLLLDTRSRSVTPLVDSPLKSLKPPVWASDGKSVFLGAIYLPLDVADGSEVEARRGTAYDVRLQIPNRVLRKVSSQEWPIVAKAPLNVTLEEDVNSPPRVFVTDLGPDKKVMLLDLNPQLRNVEIEKVRIVEWKSANGIISRGGLYLPPGYTAGRRYPMVIQTHGFRPDRFSIDGCLEWSSGYAARLLAAVGIVVLQTPMFADSTTKEGPREMTRYEGAIDYLDQQGLIDRNRVGIVGFSRTVYEVGYALTHSAYHFAAASLVDGIDGGYFQHIAFGPGDDVSLNGSNPIGEGLELWLRNSPPFALHHTRTPLRLLALGREAVLEEWEWFQILEQLNRPVEFILLPHADHLVVKPWERVVAQQGLVDWFRFWLKDEEDPNPAKTEQYRRWRELRKPSPPV